MGQFQEITWPADYLELTRIEELLHCRICYEYIETSVITPCSHNYCSICIRKFLHYKTQCPVCFETIYEKDLHANRVLDEFVECYLTLREKLAACIEGAVVRRGPNLQNVTPVRPPRTSANHVVVTPRKLPLSTPGQSPNCVKTPQKSIQTPTRSETNTTPRISSLFAPRSTEKSKLANRSNDKRVPCPICSTEISEIHVNKHLDDCLKRQRSMSPPKVSKNSLEPMPKYVIKLMKDSELRKFLKTYGLSTAGSRKALETRLRKFSTLYNAERDKIKPKTVQELVKQCEVEEAAEKNNQRPNCSEYMLNIDRKMEANVIEKAQKQYLEKNKDNYQKLIESINCRKDTTHSATSLSNYQTNVKNLPTTSSMSQTVSGKFLDFSDDNNESNSSIADLSQYLPPDSDSTNASYPLQHYSNNDPMRFLTLEISSDSQDFPVKSRSSSSDTKQVATESKDEAGTSQACPKSRDLLIPSNSTTGTSSMFSNENCDNSPPRDDFEATESDIFNASTEDNWSDYCNDMTTTKKSKRLVMKRVNVNDSGQSSDSETDVENTFKSLPRKSTKMQTQRSKTAAKTSAPKESGSLGEEATPSDFIAAGCSAISVSSKLDKENTELSMVVNGETQKRRSSRKRNLVSYTNISRAAPQPEKTKKAKKVLDELRVNVVESVPTFESKRPRGRRKSTDQSSNVPKLPLRKRRCKTDKLQG